MPELSLVRAIDDVEVPAVANAGPEHHEERDRKILRLEIQERSYPRICSTKPVFGAWMLSTRIRPGPGLRKPCSTPRGAEKNVPGPPRRHSPSTRNSTSPSMT